MITNKALDLIKKHEGCRLQPYKDSLGFPTIGWGHLVKVGESYPGGITQAKADTLLLSDAATAEETARTIFSNFDDLNEVRQAVLIDMAFNLGYNKLSQFKRMISAVEDEDFVSAANEMKNSKWYVQVKSRGVENCNLMRRGTWV